MDWFLEYVGHGCARGRHLSVTWLFAVDLSQASC